MMICVGVGVAVAMFVGEGVCVGVSVADGSGGGSVGNAGRGVGGWGTCAVMLGTMLNSINAVRIDITPPLSSIFGSQCYPLLVAYKSITASKFTPKMAI